MKTNSLVFSRGQSRCVLTLAPLLSCLLDDIKKSISEWGKEPEHEPRFVGARRTSLAFSGAGDVPHWYSRLQLLSPTFLPNAECIFLAVDEI